MQGTVTAACRWDLMTDPQHHWLLLCSICWLPWSTYTVPGLISSSEYHITNRELGSDVPSGPAQVAHSPHHQATETSQYCTIWNRIRWQKYTAKHTCGVIPSACLEVVFVHCAVLGIEPRASCMLNTHCSTDLHLLFLCFKIVRVCKEVGRTS